MTKHYICAPRSSYPELKQWNFPKFFSLSNSLYEFFLGHSMNIFLGLTGVHEFFSFNFPLREDFFVLRPPISFLMVRPLYVHLSKTTLILE